MHLTFPRRRNRHISARRRVSIILAVSGFVGTACSGGEPDVIGYLEEWFAWMIVATVRERCDATYSHARMTRYPDEPFFQIADSL